MTSRSSCANDSRTLRVSRPIEVALLKAWVTDTKEHPAASKRSTRRAKSVRAGQAVDPLNHHQVDPARIDVGQQALEGGALQSAAGHAAVVVPLANRAPALMLLAGNVGCAGGVLRVQGVEDLLQPLLGDLRV